MSNLPPDRRSAHPEPIAPTSESPAQAPVLGGRDRQREETRRRVFESALVVFRRDGVNACKIEDIARAAGVSRGTFYFHFPTKDDVLIELFRISEQRVANGVVSLDANMPLDGVLENVCSLIANEWQDDPKIFPDLGMAALRLISSLETGVEDEPVRAALVPHFRAAAEQGKLSENLPPETLVEICLLHIFAAALAWSGKPMAPLDTVLRVVVQLFLHGAGRRADA